MNAVKIKNYTGFSKELIALKIQLYTFFHYTAKMLSRELSFRKYIRVLKRLLFFLSSMKHNKFVKIGKRVKINLYVPGFPSKAFYTACDKVLEFDNKMPCITTLISVTSACKYNCEHCYQKYDTGKDVDIEVLVDTVKKLQNKGVAFFNIEGGEPFLVFDRLLRLCNTIDERSEILINATGEGMTLEKLEQLAQRNNLLGIMFSLHTHSSVETNKFMGSDRAWQNMVNGIELCHKAGIAVTFNSCLLKNAFYDGSFEKVMAVAKEFNGAILQLIKPKPAGGWLNSSLEKFTREDENYLLEKVDTYNLKGSHNSETFISAMIREESSALFGCTAGAVDRFYINAKGDVQPCEFLNISFGNIATDNFDTIYATMRETFKESSTCLLCEKYAGEIAKIKEQENLKTLPLTPELSKRIYQEWNRDGKVDFYEKLYKK